MGCPKLLQPLFWLEQDFVEEERRASGHCGVTYLSPKAGVPRYLILG